MILYTVLKNFLFCHLRDPPRITVRSLPERRREFKKKVPPKFYLPIFDVAIISKRGHIFFKQVWVFPIQQSRRISPFDCV